MLKAPIRRRTIYPRTPPNNQDLPKSARGIYCVGTNTRQRVGEKGGGREHFGRCEGAVSLQVWLQYRHPGFPKEVGVKASSSSSSAQHLFGARVGVSSLTAPYSPAVASLVGRESPRAASRKPPTTPPSKQADRDARHLTSQSSAPFAPHRRWLQQRPVVRGPRRDAARGEQQRGTTRRFRRPVVAFSTFLPGIAGQEGMRCASASLPMLFFSPLPPDLQPCRQPPSTHIFVAFLLATGPADRTAAAAFVQFYALLLLMDFPAAPRKRHRPPPTALEPHLSKPMPVYPLLSWPDATYHFAVADETANAAWTGSRDSSAQQQ
ncbi:hypothetical protein CPLU01_12206 [Colletotrichum plurivorum]|uniref:Uncharacterized protein n=1 Tax=Colletotrichum plurivorum TaxID=2175906 RepID=A0A8H6JZU3_9PEZI|nr:hypothetical protein CPLU01_12206 [Colletotrichum plurivorum]